MLLRDLRTFGLLFESLALRDLEIYAEAMEAQLYHYQDYDGDDFDIRTYGARTASRSARRESA